MQTPEQRGPANALWMRVWETSQGGRTHSGQHHNDNYTALDVFNNVAAVVVSSNGVCSSNGNATASLSSSLMNATSINATAISSLGMAISNGNVQNSLTPANANGNSVTVDLGKGKMSQTAGCVFSSLQESGADVVSSQCSLDRTFSANVTGNINKNAASANSIFNFSDNMHNNVNYNYHRQLQERPSFNVQPICVKGHQIPPSALLNHHNHHPGRGKSDKASTYGMNYLLSNCTNGNYAISWIPWNTRKYNPGLLG